MRLHKQALSVARILFSRLTGKRIPVAVRWNLLQRCPYRCAYCNLWRSKSDELSTGEILSGLAQFSLLGTTRISFSGGEPLLRTDIGRLVSEAARLGISPTLNTSGFGLAKRIGDLGDLDLVKISMDGPEEVHDRARGRKGAYRAALEAADLARERLRKMTFAATITRHNIKHLGFLLDMARRYDTLVAFQPLKTIYRGVKELDSIAPSPGDFHAAVRMLIQEKRSGHPGIRNSLAELKHMSSWPDFPPIRCGAGRIFVMIQPDGSLLPCDRIAYDAELPNLRALPVRTALARLPRVQCSGCAFCGSLQLNLLYSTKSWPVREVVRFVN